MVAVLDGQTGIMSDRVKDLRERLRTSTSRVCAERSRLYTEAWKASDGEPLDIRWARMFEKFMHEKTVPIRDGELIVGSQTKYVIGACADLTHDVEPALVMRNDHFTMRGEKESGKVSAEERASILEDAEYWDGKSVQCKIRNRRLEVLGDDIERALSKRVVVVSRGKSVSAMAVDYRKVLGIGLRGIIAEAKSELSNLTFSRGDDAERHDFLRAVIIVLESVIVFARRHAAAARDLARQETDPIRKRELAEIAEICDRVPEHPARNFREAVQSYWFIFLCAYMDSPTSVGRLDQYLYPFYKRDLEEGILTRSQAGELLGLLWIKFNELTQFQDQYLKELSQGEVFQTVTIGGADAEGRDATNDLSDLILDVARELKLTRPSVALTYNPEMSEDFLLKAIETNRVIGGGIPSFLNGTVSTANLQAHGFSLADARDHSYAGCVHPYGAGSGMLAANCNINGHKVFELALNNGIDPKTGERLGPATGDPREFQSFEQLVDAFKSQWTYWVDILVKVGNLNTLSKKQYARTPFHSALTPGCIENGRDILREGWKYPQYESSFNARGLQNVANSMAAIKRLVFDDQKTSMADILDALRTNFEGQEELRQQMLAAPKWGNDDEEIDNLHAELWAWTTLACQNGGLRPWIDGPAIVRRGGATWHYLAGRSCGAFPDGRKASEPMGDGNVSAVPGTDLKGPTALINSASKLNQKLPLSNLFNMKFPPHLLRTEENKRKLLALIRTYFERGGYHIQFNMIGKDILLDAKAHPENYRDLIVRIAGFSAYFVDLVPAVQDDIIARTEHSL